MGAEGWANWNTPNAQRKTIKTTHVPSHTALCVSHVKVICSSVFSDSGVGAGIDSYYEYLMKAYILLGDNVFLERFNIVSPPSLHVHIEVCIQAFGACCIVLTTAHFIHNEILAISLSAHVFFMTFVCNSTTVPLWSTSVSLPCCSMYTCTTPLWACAAGWTLSWHSSLAYRSGTLPHDRTQLIEFTAINISL